jgi:tetratricopeptide (TPR) repeat protein
MIPGMIPEETANGLNPPYKYIVLTATLITLGGIILAWLGGQGILPLDPSVTLGMTILLATIFICCSAAILQVSYATRMVNYSEMEIRYEEGMEYFENEEWENALLVFTELSGPKRDHKRGTYYSACCYEKLGDWENVKKYTTAYLKMKPKDAEAWEMLSRAHKSLFEYEEAQYAKDQANRFR